MVKQFIGPELTVFCRAAAAWSVCACGGGYETAALRDPGGRGLLLTCVTGGAQDQPIATPATVAWTPPLYISTQTVTYHHQPRIRAR